MVHAFDFLRTAGGKSPDPLRPIYAVVGEDAYLRDEAIHAIIRRAVGPSREDAEMAVSRVAGESAKLSSVLDEVRTLPFLAKCRVVVVDNADPFVSSHRAKLEAYAEKPSAAGVLILSAKSWPATTRLAKIVEKSGQAIECKAPPEREIATWLVELARTRGAGKIKLDNDAAHLMVELVGPEVGLLASEVDKLIVYVGDRTTIRRDDVAKMVGSGRTEKIWNILDAATLGRAGEAVGELDHLLASGEAPLRVMAAISSNLGKLHHAGQLRLARVDLRSACQTAGIYPAGVEKAGKQHAHLGPARVAALPQTLLQAEFDLKGESQLPPEVVLERLLVELAQPRRD